MMYVEAFHEYHLLDDFDELWDDEKVKPKPILSHFDKSLRNST